MGNRAVISFKDDYYKKEDSPSIYLHWQGGRDSVEAFLDASKRLGIRGTDSTYCMARMTQIISNWLGGGQTGIGIGCYSNLDTDNGQKTLNLDTDEGQKTLNFDTNFCNP